MSLKISENTTARCIATIDTKISQYNDIVTFSQYNDIVTISQYNDIVTLHGTYNIMDRIIVIMSVASHFEVIHELDNWM